MDTKEHEEPIHALSKAMFCAYNDYVKKHYGNPKLRVTFSPAGYQKVILCEEAVMRFSRPGDDPKVNGYPFSIERYQAEDFIIHIKEPK